MKNYINYFLICLSIVIISSCSKGDDNDNNDNLDNPLPDAVFTMNVSGAESHTFSFTLPENVASDYAINGAYLASQTLLSIQASPLPITWQYGIFSDVPSIAPGTYDITVDLSAFINPSQTTSYVATSGTITITNATLYQSVGVIDDWFIDGTYTGSYSDISGVPAEVTISGTFSGVNIKAQ